MSSTISKFILLTTQWHPLFYFVSYPDSLFYAHCLLVLKTAALLPMLPYGDDSRSNSVCAQAASACRWVSCWICHSSSHQCLYYGGWDWPRCCWCLSDESLSQLFLFSLVSQWMLPHSGTWLWACKLWDEGNKSDWHWGVPLVISSLWFWHIIREPNMCAQFLFSVSFTRGRVWISHVILPTRHPVAPC